MTYTLTLSNEGFGGDDTVDLLTYGQVGGYGLLDDGAELGPVPGDGGPQVFTGRVEISGSSDDDLIEREQVLRRLLKEAGDWRRQGLGRRVEFTVSRPNGSVVSVWDVRGGDVAPGRSAFHSVDLANVVADVVLRLDLAPSARTTETTVVNAATLRMNNGITHRYIHYSGATVFSENMAGLIDGQLWQRTLYGTAPSNATPQANDVQYFGNADAAFTELAFGLRTAGSGITYGNWQYWNGSAWATLTVTNPFASGSNPFGLAGAWKAITWASPSGWAATTINGVSAFWIRLVVSSVSSPVSSVVSGPFCSATGRGVIGASAIGGDLPARPKLTLRNPAATALAEVRAAVQTGRAASAPPPWLVPLIGDLYTPSGDVTAANVTDAGALYGRATEVTLAASLSDRAQTLDGSTEYINAAVTAYAGGAITAANKLDAMGLGSFFVEIIAKLDAVPAGPICLVSRWNTTNQVFWLGIDGGKLRGLVYNSGGTRKTVNGSVAVPSGEWFQATLEFDASAQRIRLYQNGDVVGDGGCGKSALRTNVATAIRVGRSVGFSTSDSIGGSTAEGYLDGAVGHVYIYGNTVANWITTESLEHDDYNFANGEPVGGLDEGKRADSTRVRWLLQMDDNAASLTIVDTAVLQVGALNAARSAANTSTTTTLGILVAGAGSFVKVLSTRVPLPLGREYATRYLPILRARQTATLTSVDDVAWNLQFGPGDASLPLDADDLEFPDVGVPSASGYYLLPGQPVTLPPADLSHYRSGEGARSYLQVDVFAQHAFVISTTMRLDCVILLPLPDCTAVYRTFRDGEDYVAANALAQNEAAIFDRTGLWPIIEQSTSDGLTPERNAYREASQGGAGLRPDHAAWLVGFAQRGTTQGTDHTESVITDTITASIVVQPRSESLAVA